MNAVQSLPDATSAARQVNSRLLDVQPTAKGLWHVSSPDRWIGGTFINRKAALAFAHDEAAALDHAIVTTHDGGTLTREEFLHHALVAITTGAERRAA